MILSLDTSNQHQQQQQSASGRKWTRPDGVASLTANDLKWGTATPRQHRALHNPTVLGRALRPLDRGASWLLHLPVKHDMKQRNAIPDDFSAFVIENSIDFDDNKDFFESLLQWEERQGLVQPYSAGDAVAATSRTMGFVKLLVAQMATDLETETLVAVDGRLHKPNFAKLILKYLAHLTEAQTNRLHGSATATTRPKRSVGSIAKRRLGPQIDEEPCTNVDQDRMAGLDSTAFVQALMRVIEQDAAAASISADADAVAEDYYSVVTSEGRLDLQALEDLVTFYVQVALLHVQQLDHNNDDCDDDAKLEKDLTANPTVQDTSLTDQTSTSLNVDSQNLVEKPDKPRKEISSIQDSILSTEPERSALAASDHSGEDDTGTLLRTEARGERVDGSGYKYDFQATHFAQTQAASAFSNDHSSDPARTLASAMSQTQNHSQGNPSSSTIGDRPGGLQSVNRRLSDENSRIGTHTCDDDEEGDMLDDAIDERPASDDNASFMSPIAPAARFTPDQLQLLQLKMKSSGFPRGATLDSSIIGTDGTDIDGGEEAKLSPKVLANLLLSPTVLTKRHQQAIRAIEARRWEQVSYLMSANPWLAEMTDVKTGQYLLHKLALFGGGEIEVDPDSGEALLREPAPDQLNVDLTRLFPAAVHKFDQDGNLPLHMAAFSGNVSMVKLLGDRFPSGASVRNQDGMLPLHLTVLACATGHLSLQGDETSGIDLVQSILTYFPEAVGVADNDGNLPIHTAAKFLSGDVGVEVIFLLLDEAERQSKQPFGIRFRTKVNQPDQSDELSVATESTASPTDSSSDIDQNYFCNLVRNELGETPLMAAITSQAGWEVVEALVCGPGGVQAALAFDSKRNNALHLLVGGEFRDPDAALSVLKVARAAASMKNDDGMLPIEIACLHMMDRDVILALLLADLPIDLDQTSDIKVREGFGASWWYLTCDCDDHYLAVVEEAVSLCSYAQVRTMCFLKDASNEILISRATPKCRSALRTAVRFVGRFEFVGVSPVDVDCRRGTRAFDALDFGTSTDPNDEGKGVILKSFSSREAFDSETSILTAVLDSTLVEEIVVFSVGGDYWGQSPDEAVEQYFVSVEQPVLTLKGVLQGMLASEYCQSDSGVRQRYALKVLAVLRLVAKGLRYLHSLGIVHGNLNVNNCAKFYNDNWKLAGILGSMRTGDLVNISRLSSTVPPESLEPVVSDRGRHGARFRVDLICSPSIDVWSFGKVAYEVLVGESLVQAVNNKNDSAGQAMMDIVHWNSLCCEVAQEQLRRVGVPPAASDLIARCLSPDPRARPSMDQILNETLWKELRSSGTYKS